jgi:hypothetical protein
VTAFGWTDDVIVGRHGQGAQYRDILLDHSRRALAAALQTARERHPELTVSDELRIGSPIGTLWPTRRARLNCWSSVTADLHASKGW